MADAFEIKENKPDVDGGVSSIMHDLHLGNFVELYLDGTFFGRTDEKYENYGGHVTLLEGRTIGLSITPKENKQHGYLRETEQDVVEISSDHVRRYIVFN